MQWQTCRSRTLVHYSGTCRKRNTSPQWDVTCNLNCTAILGSRQKKRPPFSIGIWIFLGRRGTGSGTCWGTSMGYESEPLQGSWERSEGGTESMVSGGASPPLIELTYSSLGWGSAPLTQQWSFRCFAGGSFLLLEMSLWGISCGHGICTRPLTYTRSLGDRRGFTLTERVAWGPKTPQRCWRGTGVRVRTAPHRA